MADQILYTQADVRRFWSCVDRSETCWLYTRSVATGGYGSFYSCGRNVAAHRFAWVITNGQIPEGLYILHRCDNPLCCNPSHLWLGTIGDNNRDRSYKGRSSHLGRKSFGMMNGRAKLTEQQVMEIRGLYRSDKCSYSQLAQMFDVDKSVIYRIIVRKSWKHI